MIDSRKIDDLHPRVAALCRLFVARCGAVAESLGLEWAGRWKGALVELAHCQWTGGLTLADLQAGETIPA